MAVEEPVKGVVWVNRAMTACPDGRTVAIGTLRRRSHGKATLRLNTTSIQNVPLYNGFAEPSAGASNVIPQNTSNTLQPANR